MDFNTYLEEEFGPNRGQKKDTPPHPKELEYYNTLSQKFYEENFLLILFAIILGSFIFLAFLIISFQTDFSYIANRISFLFHAIAGVTLLSSIVIGIIAHSLFTHYQMLTYYEETNKSHVLSALNKAYTYKQANKILFLFSVAAIVLMIIARIITNIPLFISFAICISAIFFISRSYLKGVKKSAQQQSISSLKPLLDYDNPSLFSEIAGKIALPQNEEAKISSFLAPTLLNPSAKVRLYAVKSLTKYAPTQALEHIINMLGDNNEEVRAQAALSLSRLGERGSKEALKSLLFDEHEIVRRCAAESVGKLKIGSASNILLDMLEDESSEVRGCVAEALGSIGKTKVIPELIKKINDPDWFVRHKIVIALGKFASILEVEQINQIMNLITDDNEYVSHSAENTLKKILAHLTTDHEMYEPIKNVLEKIDSVPLKKEDDSVLEEEQQKEDETNLDADGDMDDMEDW